MGHGWQADELIKLAGGNLLRVFSEVNIYNLTHSLWNIFAAICKLDWVFPLWYFHNLIDFCRTGYENQKIKRVSFLSNPFLLSQFSISEQEWTAKMKKLSTIWVENDF